MFRRIILTLLAVTFVFAQAWCEEDSSYLSPWRDFSCVIPQGWTAFGEKTRAGYAVHILGPDDPNGSYRTGIDIHWFDSSRPEFVPVSKAVDSMRAADPLTGRSATILRVMRGADTIARIFETTENRWLPTEKLPALKEHLHSYVAILPRGKSYWIVTLSSTRSVYLDYHDTFVDFLRSFHPIGY
jgi:hypothetical protein